jgi:hypothetical protein
LQGYLWYAHNHEIIAKTKLLITFKVGVRSPFSIENGSATRVMALANSNPRNCSCQKYQLLLTVEL